MHKKAKQTRTLIKVRVNGAEVDVPLGATVAAAVYSAFGAEPPRFRRSVSGEPRAPLCGMGICYECRVTIDGRAHEKSCQIPCAEGMDVKTDD
jgi:predicted molibdopterin-dependent oxidoreductase YjgC